jgi:TrmH family RNA methyltransferase
LAALRRLAGSRAARRELGLFVVEGPRLLAEALAASLEVHEVFVEDPERWPGATLVRPGTLDRVGDAETSQGVVALVKSPRQRLGDVMRGAEPLVFVLVDIADPGNLGTVLRSAEACGATGVIVAGRSVDPLSPKVVRASAGALFRVPLAVVDGVEEALALLEERGCRRWATVVDGGTELYDCELTGPTALLLGSEAHGLDPRVLDRPGVQPLTIPMAASVESLNVAMAATVAGFEAQRQRRAAAVALRPVRRRGGRAEDGRAGGAGNGLDAPVGEGQALEP